MIYEICKNSEHFECPKAYIGLPPCQCPCHKQVGTT